MNSSTSSSKPEPVYVRPLADVGRSGWLALALGILLTAGFETWARVSEGLHSGDYRNSPGAWAEQRRRIDHGPRHIPVRKEYPAEFGAEPRPATYRPETSICITAYSTTSIPSPTGSPKPDVSGDIDP